MSKTKAIIQTIIPIGIICLSITTYSNSLSSYWNTVKGTPEDNQLNVGMWTYHYNEHSRKTDNATNNTLAINYQGYYFAYFKNSFYNNSLSAGLQRNIYHSSTNAEVKIGYRTGIITGYDERLCHFCGSTPAIPFIIPYIDLEYKHLGIESQFAYILSTIGFYYRY